MSNLYIQRRGEGKPLQRLNTGQTMETLKVYSAGIYYNNYARRGSGGAGNWGHLSGTIRGPVLSCPVLRRRYLTTVASMP